MATKLGKDVKIRVDLNSVGGAGASWATITQQRTGSDDLSPETADASSKDSGGYVESVITRVGWSVSADGLYDPADPALSLIRSRIKARLLVWVQIDASAAGGTKEEGTAVAKVSRDYSDGDLVAFSVEFTGSGSLVVSP